MNHPTDDPLRQRMQNETRWCGGCYRASVECTCADRRAALAAASQPAPAPADERAAMIDFAEEAGRLVNHCSDDSGLPDVGMSLGLGDGRMLFVGDNPDGQGTALVIYEPHDRTIIAHPCDREAGYEMLETLAAGWTRGSDAAGQLAALTAAINAERDALIKYDRTPSDRGGSAGPKGRAYSRWLNCRADVVAALARPSAPETLGWGIVRKDGEIIAGGLRNKEAATNFAHEGERIVRVAIRVVEDGGE